MNPTMTKVLRDLVHGGSIAALGTLHGGEPFVSMVPYATLPEGGGFLIHVSGLSSHTKDMLAHPRVSLMLVADETRGVPPQARPRVTVQADAEPIDRSSADHPAAKAIYLARFHEAAQMFELGDFSLFRIRPVSARFIAGFGQAFSLTPESFSAALR
jgi:heme oxygenase (biliverdin-IX-beta and delta-forming)